MRDLKRYPVTLREATDAVERALLEYEDQLKALPPGQMPVGSIHGVALQDAINRLKRLEFAAT